MLRLLKNGLLIASFSFLSGFPFLLSANAQPNEEEINYLIDRVGRDGCSFVRNDRRYRGREARAHLRSKFRRNAHLINSTEDFISKLASTSAMTDKPYVIRCRGEDEQTANVWFNKLLTAYRSNQ